MLRLESFLRNVAEAPRQVVLEHVGFRRSQQRLECGEGVEAEIVRDDASLHGITLLHCRFRSQQPTQLRLSIEGAHDAQHERGYLAPHPAGGCIWLPTVPVARRYDRHWRIEREEPGDIEFIATPATLEIRANVNEGDVVELPFVHGYDNGDAFAQEITSVAPIEQIRLHQDAWYDVDGVSQLWKYLIHGRVHDPRWNATGTRIECQQCARTWYAHLGYLHKRTGKRFYGALRDVIAYSVLLSLPSDHRWRHGEWTDAMETHTRFQADGIHLLAQHYEVSGNEEFLDAACGAADYLIGIADALDEGAVWYRHDTLELEEDPKKSGYPRNRRSRAFGKHLSNTLCLNTHAWTLTALGRLARISQGDRRRTYEQAFARGMQALHMVLSANAGTAVYGGMYAVRDTCLRWKARTGATMPLRFCDALLHRALRRLKPRLPRLAMPNGYIERDLERSTLADRYVPVNLKDLALLARLTGGEWLRPFVTRGLSHWVRSGLLHREVARSPTAQHSLDAALLLAEDDASCQDLARQIFRAMHAAGRAVTVDALADIAGTDDRTLSRQLLDATSTIVLAGNVEA